MVDHILDCVDQFFGVGLPRLKGSTLLGEPGKILTGIFLLFQFYLSLGQLDLEFLILDPRKLVIDLKLVLTSDP